MHPVILLGRTDAGGREASMEKDMRRGAFLPVLRGLLAILISLGIGLGITWMMEWGAGWRLYATHRNAGLIWGPYSVVEHATEEFSYQGRINNLGFPLLLARSPYDAAGGMCSQLGKDPGDFPVRTLGLE